MNIQVGDEIIIKRDLENYKYYRDRGNPEYGLHACGNISQYGGEKFVVKKIKRKYYPYPERVVIRHPRYWHVEIELSKEMFIPMDDSSISYLLEKRSAA